MWRMRCQTAGPLVAAAVRFDYARLDADAFARLADLNDSKKLSSQRSLVDVRLT